MSQFIHLVGDMSPYLLLGFLLAGLMHAFIPGGFYAKYLSKNGFRSVLNAALLGIPLPLCSCGVIPTAMSLRKEGASKGAVVSFLIATPQTGVDSILATYGLMGLPFAVIRPIAALVTALFGGATIKGEELQCNVPDATSCSCGDHEAHAPQTFWQKIVEALRFGFVEMMQDIGKWLIVGLIVAAFITIAIPTEWFAVFHESTWASMLLVLCIAIPMYVCATGSIPIAVALMMKGLTPGAALVLLMAGPACNAASILVVRKVLGTRTLIAYLASIIVCSIVFGYIVDYLHFNGIIDFLGGISMTDSCCMEQPTWITWTSIAVLAILLFNALVLHKHHHHHHDTETINNTTMKTYKIEGMNCNHCRMSAEKAIKSVAGVTSVTVDLQKKEAYVEGNATDEAIRAAVEEVGFRVG